MPYTLVTIDNYHTTITDYIKEKNISISDYDDMKDCILQMIKDFYCFNFDKNLLRGFMEDFTYMYNSSDEKNRDRIINMLDESSDEEDDDDNEMSGNPMENMMQMLMGGMAPPGQAPPGPSEEPTESTEEVGGSTNVD